jgi:hypothetical protein
MEGKVWARVIFSPSASRKIKTAAMVALIFSKSLFIRLFNSL